MLYVSNERFIPTFKVHQSILHPLDLDGLIGSLIALELDAAGPLVAHEALIALQDEDGSVDQVEEVPRVVRDAVAVGEQMPGLLVADIFSWK